MQGPDFNEKCLNIFSCRQWSDMRQTSMTIESPCIKVCVIDPASGLCRGCGRTLSEIGAWVSMQDSERREIMAALPARLQTAKLTDHIAPQAPPGKM
jgi:predicted Fe-S protein YdhL (DUF1289 family)